MARSQAPSAGPLARTSSEWAKVLAGHGGRPFHAKQLFRWIHGRSVLDPEKMTDLPSGLRSSVIASELLSIPRIERVHASGDGTRKILLALEGGVSVETVLIPGVTGVKTGPSPALEDADASAADDEDDEPDAPNGVGSDTVRVTQCISTQVGCAMGCVFCASGVAGLKRNMTADEIIAQVILGKSLLSERERLTNVVLMGMGEPLHNYDATAQALRLLTHPDGISLSNRRITVSTSGLVPEIARLGADFGGAIGLAISLHAADDETRSRLMPINRKYPLSVLISALSAYPLPPRRRITIEYTVVLGKNDSVADAKRLASLLRPLRVKINLIPMNPIEQSTLGPPDYKSVLAFQNVLIDAGYTCFIRKRRGDDVSAACGQLALLGAKPKVRVNRT